MRTAELPTKVSRVHVRKVTIEGYRSIRDSIELHLESTVTVVLGPNDHGKTNLLEALQHLNPRNGFDEERDLNWDRIGQGASLPALRFELELTSDERMSLREAERLDRQKARLSGYLAEAQATLADSEKRAAAARGVAEKAAAALSTAIEAKSSVDDSGVSTPSEPVPADGADTRVRKLELDLEEARHAVENADGLVTATADLLAAVESHLIETKASIAGEPVTEAVKRASDSAQDSAQAAIDALDLAKNKEAEARAAAEAAEAQHGAGSEVHEEHRKALTAAVTGRISAARRDRSARGKAKRLSRALAAVEARDSGRRTQYPHLLEVSPADDADVPIAVSVSRIGVDGDLLVEATGFGDEILSAFVRRLLPRVEIIRPVDKIPDSTNREQLNHPDMAFMRGIFHYAGLQPNEWDDIFVQTDATTLRLENASEVLNRSLTESWSQGRRLKFSLDHNSKSKKIELKIKDPAVTKRFVRASRRSSGFTHFFALKTVLYALQKEAPANSYLWVFDEPGVYLHPDGQHDLVQVMETLARVNQVVYTTHSVFMANKNFPTRHRLVVKKRAGSTIDGKPYQTRWRPAIEALGMSLPGTLLFASQVLLVEGDSDSILVNATLQHLLALGQLESDVNGLAVMAAGDPSDAAALVRILRESEAGPGIAAMFDGDDGGRRRQRALARVDESIEVRMLTAGTTTEDHVPAASTLYPQALTNYIYKVQGLEGDQMSVEEIHERVTDRLSELDSSKEWFPKGLSSWSRMVGQEIGGLEETPSPVGVAREYALLLPEISYEDNVDSAVLRRAREMARWIADTLKLPALTLTEEQILLGNQAIEDEIA